MSTKTELSCRKCRQPLREGDDALVFDMRAIRTRGDRVTFTDECEYEHADGCPEPQR